MGGGREETLKTLHAAAMEIQSCETVEAACERTVRAAAEVLEMEMCSVILHDGDGWLEPIASSSGAPADGVRRVRSDQGLAGKTFQTGDSYVIDEIHPDDDSDPAKDLYRSGMSAPIGDVGVFQAVSGSTHAFDDHDVEFVDLLVAHTARTIDRIEYENELEARRRTLERQNERLGKFVDVVSHDLRNPLSVAMGELELARSTGDDAHLDAVAAEHDRMGELIEDLLTLATDGRPIESREAVDVAECARRSWGHVDTAGGTLVVDATTTVDADRGRLQRLFENLFRNAVEHGSTGSRPQADDPVEHGSTSDAGADTDRVDADGGVTVTVGDLADEPGFYVADDGPGIPETDREAVFERGYSTDDSGTGFGLAIVREIADVHDWAVTVATAASGGARFEIRVA
jgi:signal transduction histidine kinase